MFAARLASRGGPEQIVIERAPLPQLEDGEVLVAVQAAAITPSELDWAPTWTHADGSPRTPVVPGHEVAGSVVAVAPGTADLDLGSAVFGLTDFYRDGAAAEYVAVAATALAERPAELDPARAAALPISALTAWQGLFDEGHLLAGERVLIHGAAGGVGSFAVQLARIGGGHVTVVSAEADFDYLRGLGADVTLDRHQPLRIAPASIDLVFDAVGGEVVDRSWPLLAPDGRLVSIAPSSRDIAKTDARGRFFIVTPDRGVLEELARLVVSGELVVNVAREFPLAEARQAYEFGRLRHPRGKVVLGVRD